MPTKIFISYSHEDKPIAKLVAEALRELGYEVFWDVKIPTGTTFDTYIYKELKGSNAVIVLWSKYSIHSDYVKEEADYAKTKSILVPLNVDGTHLPFGFSRLQATDISGWHGEARDLRWERVANSIEAILNEGATHPPDESQPQPPPRPVSGPPGQRRQVSVAAVMAAILVLTVLVGLALGLAVHFAGAA